MKWNFENPHKYLKLDKDTKKKQSLFSFVHHNHFHFHDKEGFPVRTNLLYYYVPSVTQGVDLSGVSQFYPDIRVCRVR